VGEALGLSLLEVHACYFQGSDEGKARDLDRDCQREHWLEEWAHEHRLEHQLYREDTML
jgi:hypothetical protein